MLTSFLFGFAIGFIGGTLIAIIYVQIHREISQLRYRIGELACRLRWRVDRIRRRDV